MLSRLTAWIKTRLLLSIKKKKPCLYLAGSGIGSKGKNRWRCALPSDRKIYGQWKIKPPLKPPPIYAINSTDKKI